MKNVLVAAVCALMAEAFPLLSATNYWDNNGETAGFGAAGGTWGVDQVWSADSTGASVPAVANTTDSDDLFFGTADTGLTTGTITVEGTSQAFRSITFGSASGAINLSGGTLNLAAPVSTIIVNNTSNTIDSVLAGTNGLQKYRPDSLTNTNFLTTNSVTLFTNVKLSNCVAVAAIMGGGFITGTSTPGTSYFFTNNGTNATVQIQAYNGDP